MDVSTAAARDSPGRGGASPRTRRFQRTAGVAAQPGAGARDRSHASVAGGLHRPADRGPGPDRSRAPARPKGRLAGDGSLAGAAAVPPAAPAASPAEAAGDNEPDQPPDRGMRCWRRSARGLAGPAATAGSRRVRTRPAGNDRDRVRPAVTRSMSSSSSGPAWPNSKTTPTASAPPPYRPARLALWAVPDARARILQLLAAASDDAPLERFCAGARRSGRDRNADAAVITATVCRGEHADRRSGVGARGDGDICISRHRSHRSPCARALTSHAIKSVRHRPETSLR